jgi:hypothetical protein
VGRDYHENANIERVRNELRIATFYYIFHRVCKWQNIRTIMAGSRIGTLVRDTIGKIVACWDNGDEH